MTKFAERLRFLRAARHWSQERLGFELGVVKATISKWENGLSEPNFAQILTIKRTFSDAGVTLDYLLDPNVDEVEGTSISRMHVTDELAESADALRRMRFPQDFPDDEFILLAAFRRLTVRQKKSLIGLIG